MKKTGTLSVALTASANGSTYRLRSAAFAVTGPQSASLSSETNINAADIQQTLTEGTGYAITLGPLNGNPWYLERLDDAGPTTVNAALIGPATRNFTIVANGGTNVQYSFNVDGAPIVLGTGLLDVTIAVNQCPNGQVACSTGCTDLSANRLNCGVCGNACGPNMICTGPAVCSQCPVGLTACGTNSCVDTNSDPQNCGGCGNLCPNMQPACSMGVCF